MNVIALLVLAVETKPGSNVKYPRSLYSLPISTAGSPRVPLRSGRVLVLLVALSVSRTVLSDTADSLIWFATESVTRRHTDRTHATAHCELSHSLLREGYSAAATKHKTHAHRHADSMGSA